jgi:hypothetical protein
MTVDPTRDQFDASARMHLRAANAAANHDGGQPRSAAYLAHVAAECAIKRRILANHGKTRTRDMETALGDNFKKIFASKDGHDLGFLSSRASLRRLLEAEKQTTLLDSKIWARMVKPGRPYSLRYGTETLGAEEAKSELALVEALAKVLLRRV